MIKLFIPVRAIDDMIDEIRNERDLFGGTPLAPSAGPLSAEAIDAIRDAAEKDLKYMPDKQFVCVNCSREAGVYVQGALCRVVHALYDDHSKATKAPKQRTYTVPVEEVIAESRKYETLGSPFARYIQRITNESTHDVTITVNKK